MKDVVSEVYFPTICFLAQPALLPSIYSLEHLLFNGFLFLALHNLCFTRSYRTLSSQKRCLGRWLTFLYSPNILGKHADKVVSELIKTMSRSLADSLNS